MSRPVLPRPARQRGRTVHLPRAWVQAVALGAPLALVLAFGLGRWTAPGGPAAEPEPTGEASSMRGAAPRGGSTSPAFGQAAAVEPASTVGADTATAAGPVGPEPGRGVARSAEADRAEVGGARAGGDPARASTESPAPEPPPTWTLGGRPPPGRFGLQVAAFPSRSEARRFLDEHGDVLGDPLFLLERTIDGRAWFRVRVGAFEGAQAARAARRALPEALGAGAMVVRYR